MRRNSYKCLLIVFLLGCGGDGASDRSLASLDAILRIPEPRERAADLLVFFETARARDLPEIVETYDAARPYLDEVGVSIFGLWWTNQDPIAAFNEGVAAAWIPPDVWISTVVREWARIAPDAALRKVQELTAAGGRDDSTRTLVLALVRGWFDADQDPRGLLGLARTLPVGRPQKEVLDVVVYRTMEKRGWPAAIELIEGLPDAADRNFKRDAFKRLATVLAAENPAVGVEWAMRHAAGPYGEHLLRRLGRRWAHDDGQAAIAWAAGLPDLPDHEEKDRVLQETFRGWAGADLDAAVAWTDAQALRPGLEPVVRMSVVGVAHRRDPAAAMARVEALPDSVLRDGLVIDVGRIWLRSDPVSAEAWLSASGLSSDVEREIRAPVDKRSRPVSASAR